MPSYESTGHTGDRRAHYDWQIRLNLCFLWPTRVHNPNCKSIVFVQMTVECPYTLQWDAPFPKYCPFPWGIWTASNTWFPGPTRVSNRNGISIGSAFFAGITSVTDRPTDHATRSVTTGRIYVRSTAMRPNDINNNNNKTVTKGSVLCCCTKRNTHP